jgi:hypothetical protein
MIFFVHSFSHMALDSQIISVLLSLCNSFDFYGRSLDCVEPGFWLVTGTTGVSLFLMSHFESPSVDDRWTAFLFYLLSCYHVSRLVTRSMVLLPILSVTSLGREERESYISTLIYILRQLSTSTKIYTQLYRAPTTPRKSSLRLSSTFGSCIESENSKT